jgi:hypothetical protein
MIEGPQTRTQLDEKGNATEVPLPPSRPGQVFRHLLASALVSGATAQEEKNKNPYMGFGGGFAVGGEAAVKRDQQLKAQQKTEAKEQWSRNQEEQKNAANIALLNTQKLHVPSLIKAIARAHDWYCRIIRGEVTGSRSIAEATGLDERYVRRIFQFAFLAPDIAESILDGRQPAKMTLQNFQAHLPNEWAVQRQLLGFSAR